MATARLISQQSSSNTHISKTPIVDEDSNIVGRDAALLGKWEASFTDHMTLQDEGNVLLQNVGNHLTSDTELYHRRLESLIKKCSVHSCDNSHLPKSLQSK
jgi:hypothetical protein